VENIGNLLLGLAAWLEAPSTSGAARFAAYGFGIAVIITAIVLFGKLAALLRLGTSAGRFATRNGWTYDGLGQFSGRIGGGSWRGGPHEDEDTGRKWTDFNANLRIDRPGTCAIVARRAWRAGAPEEPALEALEGTGPAFNRRWVLAASDPSWRAVVTDDVESLLLDWPGVLPDKISASCGAHAVEVRIDGVALSAQADLERLFNLGDALARACVAPTR
jgi:hypothetical protein